MEGVLEGAAALCTCKLAFSLLSLPWLPRSRSPVSFGCCCLLLFTDFVLTAFLAFLCVSSPWPTELSLPGDALALRFLLFLGGVYGTALLLTCPLLTLEALGRLRRAQATATHAHGRCSCTQEGQQQSHAISFLCCLAVWVLAALDMSWRWTLGEVCASACVHATSSLLTCLPSLFSPMASSSSSSCIAFTFLLLLLLLFLYLTVDLPARCRASAGLAEAHTPNQRLVSGLVPACTGLPRMLASADVRWADPEKTGSSCVVPQKHVQTAAPQRGHTATISPERFPAGQKEQRRKRAPPLTFTFAEAQEERNRCVWCDWGVPCLGLNAIIGLMGVLGIFVLPLILSVNVVLVRTVEYLTELSVRALLVSPAADKRSRATSCKATGSRSTCQLWFQESGFSQARNKLKGAKEAGQDALDGKTEPE